MAPGSTIYVWGVGMTDYVELKGIPGFYGVYLCKEEIVPLVIKNIRSQYPHWNGEILVIPVVSGANDKM